VRKAAFVATTTPESVRRRNENRRFIIIMLLLLLLLKLLYGWILFVVGDVMGVTVDISISKGVRKVKWHFYKRN